MEYSLSLEEEMSQIPIKKRGLYFEEFEEGYSVKTSARTITETDIVSFAGLSGDFNQIHMDSEYAANTQFGERIAHGMLGFSIATGLAVQAGFMEGAILAFREVVNFKFSNPIYIGDTIHSILTVQALKAFPRLGGGQVDLKMVVKNQDDKTTMKGLLRFLMQSKPEGVE